MISRLQVSSRAVCVRVRIPLDDIRQEEFAAAFVLVSLVFRLPVLRLDPSDRDADSRSPRKVSHSGSSRPGWKKPRIRGPDCMERGADWVFPSLQRRRSIPRKTIAKACSFNYGLIRETRENRTEPRVFAIGSRLRSIRPRSERKSPTWSKGRSPGRWGMHPPLLSRRSSAVWSGTESSGRSSFSSIRKRSTATTPRPTKDSDSATP